MGKIIHDYKPKVLQYMRDYNSKQTTKEIAQGSQLPVEAVRSVLKSIYYSSNLIGLKRIRYIDKKDKSDKSQYLWWL